jgi:hypothetical protein
VARCGGRHDSGQQLTCAVSVLRENRGKFRLYRSIWAVMNIYAKHDEDCFWRKFVSEERAQGGKTLCQEPLPKCMQEAFADRSGLLLTFCRVTL